LTSFEGPVKVKGSMFLHPEMPFCKGIQRTVEHPDEDFKTNLLRGETTHISFTKILPIQK
jgi:hypothetical protein